MAASPPRAIRIARPAPALAPPDLPPRGPPATPTTYARNGAGIERARRLAILYVVALAALYLAFAEVTRSTSGAAGAGARDDLTLFGLVAIALALGGALVSLASAPRGIETVPGGLVVHGAFGGRRRFPDTGTLSIRVIRQFPSGLLSTAPVVGVEFSAGRLRRTYVLERGLVAERIPATRPPVA